MLGIPNWIIAVIVFNVAVFIIILNPNPNVNLFSFLSNPNATVNNVSNETKSSTVLNKSSNQSSNQTVNTSIYLSSCINSINNYIISVENISNLTTIETKFFNKTDDSINYVKNWSSNSYELVGIGNDIYALNKSVVSVNDFKTKEGKNFTLPIICDEKGGIGNYSSCILSNISNITTYCHNITTILSECDIEKLEHDFWEDINYSVFPKPGTLNTSQLFNFTITSSRNRLEYATLNINYIRPNINKNLFNQSKSTMKGDKISITTTLNLTGKTFGGLIVETYFKKKCYKYDLLSQYMY